MNKSKIEWTDASWNPITGCYHTCEYCYARRQSARFSGDVRLNIAKNADCKISDKPLMFELDEAFGTTSGRHIPFPFGFAPTLHKYRLDDPVRMKTGRKVFVGSMADIFGEWVPEKWIIKVFEACQKAPQHTYIFLTKNPKRYIELANKGILPEADNYWYGTSVTTDDTPFFWHDKLNTFISIEPLLEPFDERALDAVKKTDWIIIGAETGKRKNKVVPQKSWIDAIIQSAKEAKIPVFMKDSLSEIMQDEMLTEFPTNMRDKVYTGKLREKMIGNCRKCGEEHKKSDMTCISCKKGKQGKVEIWGYICDGCMPNFMKG